MHKDKNTYRYLLAAGTALFLMSLAANYLLWIELNHTQYQISHLSDQRKLLVQELESVNRKLSLASKDMEIIKDRSYKMVNMKGLEKSPNSNVIAFWNPVTKKVYVGVMVLPVPPPDKQYQLWAVSSGKSLDLGVLNFDPLDKSLYEMKSIEYVQAFCITLEPKGGSANPTFDLMYVMGEV